MWSRKSYYIFLLLIILFVIYKFFENNLSTCTRQGSDCVCITTTSNRYLWNYKLHQSDQDSWLVNEKYYDSRFQPVFLFYIFIFRYDLMKIKINSLKLHVYLITSQKITEITRALNNFSKKSYIYVRLVEYDIMKLSKICMLYCCYNYYVF